MGQVNSTEASSPGPHFSESSLPPPPSPSSASGNPSSTTAALPSIEDMRNMTSRILASTSEKLKGLRENMPSVEMPTGASSTSSASTSTLEDSLGNSTSGLEAGMEASRAARLLQDSLDFAPDNYSPTVASPPMPKEQAIVPRSFLSRRGADGETSVTDFVKIHYQLSVDWVKDNGTTVALGAAALGLALVVGTMTVKATQAHLEKQRRLRVLRNTDGTKREVVVITNLATLEGVALALSLEQQGFVVFAGVPSQAKADEVEGWGRPDIRPVIVDTSKSNGIDELVVAVSNFLDQKNSLLLGGPLPSMGSSLIFQEELSSSTANIRLDSPENTQRNIQEAEAKRLHHTKTESPLFRLAAVIVNPHSMVVGSVEKVDLEEWRKAIDANITGTVVAVQKFMPLMRRTLALAKPRRSPRLILMSSAITGSIGFPYQSSICASHHAIESIADSLRREVKHQGIDVVCLRPGVSDTYYRKEWGDKSKHGEANAGSLGLLSHMNPTNILRATFKRASTTSTLCEVTYDAITSKRPAHSVRLGSGSLAYSFVGWAVPRYVVDWSLKGQPIRVQGSASVKVTAAAGDREE
ncbi:hypothetical protein BGW38_005120 [Lunasporangiospora selenospora]|uniref:Short-chain dehydrogenase n=1 Tax=Lunasporangiospora selenospora TaxID=979761 RepID=A0A9P6FZS0_9FUNG|nr:hypothetical protein BGW38_005120 [Lunasporangiospora selenospora]